jgi:MFS family permease
VSRYLSILRRRGALLPFLAAVVGRLPIAMGPLGMVLLVQQIRGSYSIAGVVTAAGAVSMSVGMPLWGRSLDRFGHPWVIGATSVLSGGFMAAFALSAVHGAGDPVLLVLSAGAGLTFPPMSPAMRGAWRTVLPLEVDRRAAYALDAVAVETIFVGGPLLLSLLLVTTPAEVPLLVTASLLTAGGVAYSVTRAARDWRPEQHHAGAGHRSASPLRAPGMVALLLVMVAMAVGFGLTDVSIAATARETLADRSQVGLLFAAIASGSASGGLWYGSRAWQRPERVRLPVTLAGFAAGLLALAGLLAALGRPPLPAVLVVLLLTGLCIAPTLIIGANLIDHLGPQDRLSEAQSWLNTAFTAGGAAGTAVAGVLVDAGGPTLSFLGAGLAVAGATALAALAQTGWRRADRVSKDQAEPGPAGSGSGTDSGSPAA